MHCHSESISHGSAIVPDFTAHLLPQTLQNLRVAMLVNRLSWRDKFLMINALTVKKITTMLVMFDLICLAFFGCGEDGLSH
jgi:hypothetical protein